MAKKKEEVVEEVIETIKSGPKFLSTHQLLTIEGNLGQCENRKIMLKCMDMERQKLERELELFSANYTLKKKELEEVKKQITDYKLNHEKKLVEHKEFIDILKKEFNLKKEAGFGYDPTTGEIKE